MPAARRFVKRLLLTVVGLVALAALALQVLGAPRPSGRAGAGAEALAARMEAAVDLEAWQRTGAVRWTFRGANRHLWDRRRGFDRVRFDDLEVWVDLGARSGLAARAGRPLDDAEAAPLVARAWALWANDSFWLNPIAKLRDPGTVREEVTGKRGASALLVRYTEGGVTPGDAYLWRLGDDGLPVAWRMWTQILPVGGLRASWEGWQTLATGARVATRHRIAGLLTLRLTEVAGAATLEALEPGEDPFAALAARRPER